MRVLTIDVGGTNVKILSTGQTVPRKVPSGPTMTPKEMVTAVKALAAEWQYDAVTIGYPGQVIGGRIVLEPHNLGRGWVGFDFKAAFGRPVRIINDAAMQALASYEGGRMLFLGLGTSVGATLIADDTVVPLEIGLIPLSKSEAFMDKLSKEALNTEGKRRWQRSVERAVALLRDIFFPDVFQLGGGNAKHIDPVPERCERGDNQDSFRGAVRLWPGADMIAEPGTTTWRIKRFPKRSDKK